MSEFSLEIELKVVKGRSIIELSQTEKGIDGKPAKETESKCVNDIKSEAVKKFIIAYNERSTHTKYEYPPVAKCYARIVFHGLYDMVQGRNDYSNRYNYEQNKLLSTGKHERASKFPIIHVTLVDMSSQDNSVTGFYSLCSRYVAIMDSSIWNYYAPIKRACYKSKIFDFTQLDDVIFQIISNYNFKREFNLYNLRNTNEYADFNARLLNESYLEDGAHGNQISPFLFHSEWKMRKNNEAISDKFRDIVQKKHLKWRILLVDDYATQNLRVVGSEKTLALTKKNIVEKRLKEAEKFLGISSDNCVFELCCATSLDNAINELTTRKFDIILLDYLLTGVNSTSQYGYELLKELNRNDELIAKKGPFGKYWLIFSTGFIHAVRERISIEGFSHSDNNWHIGRTACPLNTPQLFVYNLLSLMNEQLVILTDINSTVRNKEEIVTLIDLLHYIFKDETETHQRAIESFNSLLHLASHYKILKDDYYMGGEKSSENKGNGSLLVQPLFPDLACYHYAFWEHLQHLVYLVAYGNIRQWNEMWDEYIFIKDILKDADSRKDKCNLCSRIENYIYKIKQDNF